MSACPSPGRRRLRAAAREGMALLSCTLLLMVVLMLSWSSLLAACGQYSAALRSADRAIARNAAEAALHDGQRHLLAMDDGRLSASAGVLHEFGSVSGEHYSGTGPQSATAPPHYRIDFVAAIEPGKLWQVSATGAGLQPGTRVCLQADFLIPACPQAQEQHCARQAHRVAWRESGADCA